METKFNFKSQICTSREQSERLLALGLKKETADMVWLNLGKKKNVWTCKVCIDCTPVYVENRSIPAWSLHRLLSLIPKDIEFQVSPMYGRNYTLPIELQITCELDICYIELNREEFKGFYGTDIYDSAIRCIEWLIKEGYFNKEYLV
jgi:hypothetical protein